MICYIFIVGSLIIVYKNKSQSRIMENYVVNSMALQNISDSVYEEQIVYEGLTLTELSNKIDNVLNSNLEGYGNFIAVQALENDVDPVVASAIILVETGCKWNCSYLVRACNNVGGMKGRGCGSYGSFGSLNEGIEAFIGNLSRNYYQYGLNTPELMNHKYAENPNWHNDVNYYVDLIKAS